MKNQKLTCVLYNMTTRKCRGLNELVCEKEKCPFYKDIAKYKIVAYGFVEERNK